LANLYRFATAAQQSVRSWRAFWIIVSLGLIALGAGAPGDGGIP
jgi:hypothetical protein